MPGRRGENAKRQWQAQTGVILPLLAVGMAVLLAMAGLAVDGGQAYVLRNRVQNAADAAALSAAQELKLGNGAGAAETAARATATANGFTQGVSNTTVSVSIPPGASPGGVTRSFAANPGFVRVTISRSVATGLLRAVGRNTLTPSASAVAGISPDPLPCLVARPSSTTDTGLDLQGNSSITAVNCTVAVRSTGKPAIKQQGSGSISAGTGSIWVGTGATWGGSITPLPTSADLSADQFKDPFANIPPPTIGTCKTLPVGTTYDSGTYCSNITISKPVTFNSGFYILNNVTLTVKSGGILEGDGVLIYLSGASSKFIVENKGQIDVNAPSSGTYKGMLLWLASNTNTDAFTIGSQVVVNVRGNLYLKNAKLDIGGQGTLSFGTIVAQSVILKGGADINVYNTYLTNYINTGAPLLFE